MPLSEAFNKDDIVDGVSNYAASMELETHDAAIIWAVDATLRYVVDFLYKTGQNGTADFLATEIGDL